MSQYYSPCTSANPRGLRSQPGLMGGGARSFMSESPKQLPMPSPCIGGLYATDDYTAAWYLVHQLSMSDTQMSAEEATEAALTLRELLQVLKKSGQVSLDALKRLQQAAESIPEIGPPLFSQTSLPGTIASTSGIAVAMSQTKKVSDMLDMPGDLKNKLLKWAKNRGTPGAQSASKTFRDSIKIIRKAGQLYFDIPATAAAQHYRVLGEVGKSAIHIPVGSPKAALNQRAWLHQGGAQSGLKFFSGFSLGAALAIGPQGYLDWASSATMDEFLKKSAYNQATNVASFAAGMVVTAIFGLSALAATPFVVVAVLVVGTGALVQVIGTRTGLNEAVGNYFYND